MCGAPEPSRRTSNRIRWTSAGNALKLEGAGVAQTERYLYIQSKPRCYLFAMIAFGIIALANITTATAATIDVEAELGSNVHLQSSLNDDFDQGFRRMDGRNMIMNGLTVNEKQRERYQFTASIKYGSSHLCGGTLIAPDIVLSAAHCFNQKFDIGMLQVTVGDFHLENREDGGETFFVSTIDMHPHYLVADTYLENDVLLMKIKGNSTKKVIRLNKDEAVPPKSNSLTVVGWGALDAYGTIMANELQKVNLHYVSNADCMNKWRVPYVTDAMMCAMDLDDDSKVEDSCYGDSGGPLFLKTPGGMIKQFGIVSFGSKKCGEFPGVYTRISAVYKWIQERVCDLSSNAPVHFQCLEIMKPGTKLKVSVDGSIVDPATHDVAVQVPVDRPIIGSMIPASQFPSNNAPTDLENYQDVIFQTFNNNKTKNEAIDRDDEDFEGNDGDSKMSRSKIPPSQFPSNAPTEFENYNDTSFQTFNNNTKDDEIDHDDENFEESGDYSKTTDVIKAAQNQSNTTSGGKLFENSILTWTFSFALMLFFYQ